MVSSTFSATPCLQGLTAPPQRVSQVNAYVKHRFLALSNSDRRLCYVLNIAYTKQKSTTFFKKVIKKGPVEPFFLFLK